MLKNEENLQFEFNNFCVEVSKLSYGRLQNNSDSINKLLGEINELDYRYPLYENATKAVLLVHQCCHLVAPDDPALVSKFCKLLNNLVSHQHLQIEGQTLRIVTTWCLRALNNTNRSVAFDVLLALEALLISNAEVPDIIFASDFNTLTSVFRETTSSKAKLLCIRCLVLCVTNQNTANFLSQSSAYSDVFIECLKQKRTKIIDELTYYKILTSCLYALHSVADKNQEFLNKELGLLLGICKSFMTFGIKGIEPLNVEKIVPSVLNMPEKEKLFKEKRGRKVIKKRRVRTSQNKKDKSSNNSISTNFVDDQHANSSGLEQSSDDELGAGAPYNVLLTSESDFSDSESSRMARLEATQSKIRQAALELLLYVVKKTDKSTIFTYWSSLIPDGFVTRGTHDLTSCILRDPNPRGRMAALKVLLALLVICKNYLALAESSDKPLPFTSFSVILGSMLKELHRCLCLALHENSNTVIIQALKCVAALVQATPYHKLPAGIITKITRNVKVYITHKDATVQVAALIALNYIVGLEHSIPEIKTALLKHFKDFKSTTENSLVVSLEQISISYDNDDDDYDESDDPNTQELPWLLETCLNNLGVCTNTDEVSCEIVAAPIKVESLQVIMAMSKNCFDYLIVPYLNLIIKALDICLLDSYCDLRLHTGRTIEFLGQAIAQNLNVVDHSKPLSVGQGLIFWESLLHKCSTELLLSLNYWVLRAVGCDCLGSIGPHIFQHLPKNKQILVITLLMGCSRDEEANVRAAAVRALAVCVVYPTLREDLSFVTDVARAICNTLQDTSLVVRIKSSWSLGNLSDALVLNKSDSTVEDICKGLLLHLIRLAIESFNDNTKIKVNVVRALGNLLQLITDELIQQEIFKDVVDNAIDALVKILKTSTDMKLTWNGCYAAGSLYKNPILFRSEKRKQMLFDPLIELVVNFRNFKVRINAALALSCPLSRKMYGQYFIIIWNSLLTALENTQNVEDFNEYNHRDNLVEQICFTLGHMTSLLGIYDLSAIREKTILHIELLQQKMHRTIERLLPEKSSLYLLAVSHLNVLMNVASEEHKEFISVLLSVFNNQFL